MMARKLLVIGASGFVGQYLYSALPGIQRIGTYFQHEAPGLVQLDITELDQARSLINQYDPELIYVPASWTHVDACEDNAARCMSLNDGGIKALCEVVDPGRTRLIYFSTDYVYDGDRGPYSEADETRPINVYGASKLSAERRVLAHSTKNLVIRTTVVYGWERRGKNSIQRLIKGLRAGQTLQTPVDQWGHPTYIENLVEVTLDLVKQGRNGIFHVCGAEWMNRFDFACLAAKIFDLPVELIHPAKTSELKQRAKRPLKAGMKTDKVRAVTSYPLLTPFQGLSRMKAIEKTCLVENQ